MNCNHPLKPPGALLTLPTRRLTLIGILGLVAFVSACSSVTSPVIRTSYSIPQDAISQWMIEYRTGEDKVQLTLRYDRHNESNTGRHSESHSTSFRIAPDQLRGLTREQAMSSGAHVQFQVKRDAGTFNCDGWFKEGNGSGHFTFSANPGFAAELKTQGYGEPTYEQQFSMAMNDTSLAFIKELQDQGYDKPALE